jgi:hypothetical protein
MLLVEDDPEDLELTLRAYRAENICNRIPVARDGRKPGRLRRIPNDPENDRPLSAVGESGAIPDDLRKDIAK